MGASGDYKPVDMRVILLWKASVPFLWVPKRLLRSKAWVEGREVGPTSIYTDSLGSAGGHSQLTSQSARVATKPGTCLLNWRAAILSATLHPAL